MSVTEKDLKKLWGLAAGRCSFPGCCEDLIPVLSGSDPTVIGEMAHVIAQSPAGPRGTFDRGPDTYENLILLCPTHHRMVDKAIPGTYPPDLLRSCKADHEKELKSFLAAPRFTSKDALFGEVRRLLTENRATWSTYGPDSLAAQDNPMSNLAALWQYRKLARLVPNNRRIASVIQKHADLLSESDYQIACKFFEHVEGFEQNCYERREGVPRFPKDFADMVGTDGNT